MTVLLSQEDIRGSLLLCLYVLYVNVNFIFKQIYTNYLSLSLQKCYILPSFAHSFSYVMTPAFPASLSLLPNSVLLSLQRYIPDRSGCMCAWKRFFKLFLMQVVWHDLLEAKSHIAFGHQLLDSTCDTPESEMTHLIQ